MSIYNTYKFAKGDYDYIKSWMSRPFVAESFSDEDLSDLLKHSDINKHSVFKKKVEAEVVKRGIDLENLGKKKVEAALHAAKKAAESDEEFTTVIRESPTKATVVTAEVTKPKKSSKKKGEKSSPKIEVTSTAEQQKQIREESRQIAEEATEKATEKGKKVTSNYDPTTPGGTLNNYVKNFSRGLGIIEVTEETGMFGTTHPNSASGKFPLNNPVEIPIVPGNSVEDMTQQGRSKRGFNNPIGDTKDLIKNHGTLVKSGDKFIASAIPIGSTGMLQQGNSARLNPSIVGDAATLKNLTNISKTEATTFVMHHVDFPGLATIPSDGAIRANTLPELYAKAYGDKIGTNYKNALTLANEYNAQNKLSDLFKDHSLVLGTMKEGKLEGIDKAITKKTGQAGGEIAESFLKKYGKYALPAAAIAGVGGIGLGYLTHATAKKPQSSYQSQLPYQPQLSYQSHPGTQQQPPPNYLAVKQAVAQQMRNNPYYQVRKYAEPEKAGLKGISVSWAVPENFTPEKKKVIVREIEAGLGKMIDPKAGLILSKLGEYETISKKFEHITTTYDPEEIAKFIGKTHRTNLYKSPVFKEAVGLPTELSLLSKAQNFLDSPNLKKYGIPIAKVAGVAGALGIGALGYNFLKKKAEEDEALRQQYSPHNQYQQQYQYKDIASAYLLSNSPSAYDVHSDSCLKKKKKKHTKLKSSAPAVNMYPDIKEEDERELKEPVFETIKQIYPAIKPIVDFGGLAVGTTALISQIKHYKEDQDKPKKIKLKKRKVYKYTESIPIKGLGPLVSRSIARTGDRVIPVNQEARNKEGMIVGGTMLAGVTIPLLQFLMGLKSKAEEGRITRQEIYQGNLIAAVLNSLRQMRKEDSSPIHLTEDKKKPSLIGEIGKEVGEEAESGITSILKPSPAGLGTLAGGIGGYLLLRGLIKPGGRIAEAMINASKAKSKSIPSAKLINYENTVLDIGDIVDKLGSIAGAYTGAKLGGAAGLGVQNYLTKTGHPVPEPKRGSIYDQALKTLVIY